MIEARLDDQMGRIVVRVAEMLAEDRQGLMAAVLTERPEAAAVEEWPSLWK